MSSSNVLATVFWNKDGMLLIDYMEKGATITAKYYAVLLDKLKQQLVSKHRGKLSKRILFLQDNAGPHKVTIMHSKSGKSSKHLACSPNLAPSNY
jgi:hypothetical protein